LTSTIQEATAASAPKQRPHANLRPPLPTNIQDKISLENQLRRQWQVMRDPALKAEANRLNRLATYWLNEWRNKQWNDMLESLHSEEKSLWKMTKRVM
jgi:hypothetical protein